MDKIIKEIQATQISSALKNNRAATHNKVVALLLFLKNRNERLLLFGGKFAENCKHFSLGFAQNLDGFILQEELCEGDAEAFVTQMHQRIKTRQRVLIGI